MLSALSFFLFLLSLSLSLRSHASHRKLRPCRMYALPDRRPLFCFAPRHSCRGSCSKSPRLHWRLHWPGRRASPATANRRSSRVPFHCLSTAFPLPFHCLSTAFPLPLHWLCTGASLVFHCLWTAFAPVLHCLCLTLFTEFSLPSAVLFTTLTTVKPELLGGKVLTDPPAVLR